jgi:hypothetical protein
MTASADLYSHAQLLAWTGGNFNLDTDRLNMALLGPGYTPDLAADQDWSDISANEITGTGYVSGGNELTGVSVTLTQANSWGPTWSAATGYYYGQIVTPLASPNGLLFRVVAAGTSGGSEPTWPTTVGKVVTDGSVTWACIGYAVIVFTSGTVTWDTATFTANYAVIYDAQSGTYASEPLLVLQTFGVPQSPAGVNWPLAPDPNLGWFTIPLS